MGDAETAGASHPTTRSGGVPGFGLESKRPPMQQPNRNRTEQNEPNQPGIKKPARKKENSAHKNTEENPAGKTKNQESSNAQTEQLQFLFFGKI